MLGNSVHNKGRSKAIAYDFVEKRYSSIVNLYLYTNHCSDEQPKLYFDIASALFNIYMCVTTYQGLSKIYIDYYSVIKYLRITLRKHYLFRYFSKFSRDLYRSIMLSSSCTHYNNILLTFALNTVMLHDVLMMLSMSRLKSSLRITDYKHKHVLKYSFW